MILDPIFNLLAGLLEWFYDQVPSYGFAIIALTTLVLVVLSPLTYRSTKSMVAMRKLQPQIKRLQKRHKNDRETLNAEMMKLYQEHQVSPLSGCLPILVQSPVFIVMFRVIRGITRRSSDIGFSAGRAGARVGELLGRPGGGDIVFDSSDDSVLRNFNPEYLSREPGEESQMYLDLIQETEMNWIGIDLSRTPFEVVTNSLGQALPYVLMVVLVAFLGWYQQRQIQGRMTGEISSQQQMIMRIIPWMLPIFAVTMPAGLVLYFIVSAMLRIAQQAYITRTVYENEELNKPIDFDDEDDDEDDEDDDGEPENPLAALFGGGAAKSEGARPAASARHGSRRPTSSGGDAKTRSRPASSNGSNKNGASAKKSNGSNGSGSKKSAKSSGSDAKKASQSKGSAKKSDGSKKDSEQKFSAWSRAKRSAPEKNETPEKPVSRRVTPKSDSSDRRGKK